MWETGLCVSDTVVTETKHLKGAYNTNENTNCDFTI